MCELLGFSSSCKYDVSEYLKLLSAHSPDNPHGWGIMLMQYGDISVIKESIRADKSRLLQNLLSGEIITNLLIGHIRRATIGNIDYSNCHPFLRTDRSKRQWVLFHNGTVFNDELIKKYAPVQDGNTDSERILLYLISGINSAIEQNGSLSTGQRFEIISEYVTNLSRGNKLNLMIHTDETLLVHTNMADSLYYRRTVDSIVFATVPLDDNVWLPVPMMTLLGYKKGKLIFEGKPHNFEYVYDAEDLKGVYLAYSGL